MVFYELHKFINMYSFINNFISIYSFMNMQILEHFNNSVSGSSHGSVVMAMDSQQAYSSFASKCHPYK